MTAKEYLSRYEALNDSINSKQLQAKKLRERAQSVSGGNGNGVHSSQPYDRVGDVTGKLVDLEREILEEIAKSVDVQRDIRRVIAAVPEERLRTLLEYKYINCLTLEQVAVAMHYSYPQICRLHGRALMLVRKDDIE